jgi:flagellar biosynthesis/type III secretory pathway protein FliH
MRSSPEPIALPDFGVLLRRRPEPEGAPEDRAAQVEAAYQRGLSDGSALQARSQREMDDAIAALGVAVEGLSSIAAEVRSRLGANLPALALAVARHLLQREIEADPGVMHRLVEQALAATPLSGSVTVRIHPEDLAALGNVDALRPAGSTIELSWIPDAALLRGGCVVESTTSVIDGRVDEALLSLYERLGHE